LTEAILVETGPEVDLACDARGRPQVSVDERSVSEERRRIIAVTRWQSREGKAEFACRTKEHAKENTIKGEGMSDVTVDKEVLIGEIRKFLKKVGITSQQEIERAITQADAAGCLAALASVRAQVRLEIPELDVSHLIEHDLLLR
jgi:protein required for attachment to host cells